MMGVSNHGIMKWVPEAPLALAIGLERRDVYRTARRHELLLRTFAVNILADSAYSPVLDRSVTTLDVEKAAVEDEGSAAEKHQGGSSAAEAARAAAGHATESTAGA